MNFIANVLAMNGGSTFLIRACRELRKRGRQPCVLVLVDNCDPEILKSLRREAKVIFLKDFLLDRGLLFRSHFGIFGMVEWLGLISQFSASEPRVHVMGSFGLLFAKRLTKHWPEASISVGIYHQNEFLFRKIPYILTHEIQTAFSAVSPNNVVFFNTSSRENYSHFFGVNYEQAPVLPIGVETGKSSDTKVEQSVPPKIVSIGNLVPFKTYNHHIIGVLADISTDFPDLRYDIFGDGPEKEHLMEHARKIGIFDRVSFKGAIPYSDFANCVSGATLFVGSGTALIEAADLAVPSLIGIESSESPETYGFLHEIEGFSYNEGNIGLKKRPLEACVRKVLSSEVQRNILGLACQKKAKEFSISKTIDGFLNLPKRAEKSGNPVSIFWPLKLILSLLLLGVFEKTFGKKVFSDRRSQSYCRRLP